MVSCLFKLCRRKYYKIAKFWVRNYGMVMEDIWKQIMYSNLKFAGKDKEQHEIHFSVRLEGLKEVYTHGEN